jgi:hypothetical protein
VRPSSAKSAAREKRGAKARAEMREKGYLQTCELAQKLSAELGRQITVAALRGQHERGHIQGELHKASNLWFYPADTKLPVKLTKGDKKEHKNPTKVVDEPVALGGPWVNWQAPEFVKIPMMGLKRNYPVVGRRDFGWFGAVR